MDDTIDPRVLEMNYIANRCFGEENTAWAVQGWSIARQQDVAGHSWAPVNDVTSAMQAIARLTPEHAHSTFFHPHVDPVRLAVEVLAGPEEVRRREYLERQIRTAVEDALNAREEPARQAQARASDMVQNVLERLREKAKGFVLPPAEEAWKMVDFTAFDESE